MDRENPSLSTPAQRPNVMKKRNRLPVSCDFCRSKKLKCDRQKPCHNCAVRSRHCLFAGPYDSDKRRPSSDSTPVDVRTRLHRLEALVNSLAYREASVAPKTRDHLEDGSDTPQKTERETEFSKVHSMPGRLVGTADGSHYVGASSWEAVLHDIAAIREHVDETIYPTDQINSKSLNPGILGGVPYDITFKELLASLPHRDLADRLVSRFFADFNPVVLSNLMFHKPTFLKQYATFWYSPRNASLTQLSTMYSVFSLAYSSCFLHDDEVVDGSTRENSFKMSELYRKHAAQCILKSDIAAPSRESIECLVLQTISEHARLDNGLIGQWIAIGVLIRKCLHMGLHRDPDEFPSLSPFEREMRRRLWSHVWSFDMLFSFQLGLPNAIFKFNPNVAPPRNLYEEELQEDMKELPPARPASEITPISFMIAKLHLLKALGAVVEHLNSSVEHTYNEVLDLNRQLLEAHANIPKHLQIQSEQAFLVEFRSVNSQAVQLQMIYDKATCILNRRFVVETDPTQTVDQPRALCIQSALSLLSIQVLLERNMPKWYYLCLCRHDILLAGVVLYLVLIYKRQRPSSRGKSKDETIPWDDEDIRINEALSKSQMIWASIAGISLDARAACRIFDKMRQRLQMPPLNKVTPASAQPNTDGKSTGYHLSEPQPSVMVDSDFSKLEAGLFPEDFSRFDWSNWDNSILGTGIDEIGQWWPQQNV